MGLIVLTEARRNEIVKGFLKYSFEDIEAEYGNLNPEERALCTEEEFRQLVIWVETT